MTYSDEYFREVLPEINEDLIFEDNIKNKKVTIYCIDKETTNPYRMWEREGKPEMTDEILKTLREEGKLKPVKVQSGSETLTLNLSANATYLITVTD